MLAAGHRRVDVARAGAHAILSTFVDPTFAKVERRCGLFFLQKDAAGTLPPVVVRLKKMLRPTKKTMYTILSRLDAIEAKLDADKTISYRGKLSRWDELEAKLNADERVSYRSSYLNPLRYIKYLQGRYAVGLGTCEAPDNDPHFCDWDKFYYFAALLHAACAAAVGGAIVKGVVDALRVQQFAEKQYNLICQGKGSWGIEFASFLGQGKSSNICSDLMEKREDAMQGVIQWIWSTGKTITGLGLAGLYSRMNNSVTELASKLRLTYCMNNNYPPAHCIQEGRRVQEGIHVNEPLDEFVAAVAPAPGDEDALLGEPDDA